MSRYARRCQSVVRMMSSDDAPTVYYEYEITAGGNDVSSHKVPAHTHWVRKSQLMPNRPQSRVYYIQNDNSK